ncbi:aspartate/glutamate racemase family protein [Bordetella genomosp. 12]|nr:amino acid racemase [Bordetella genomosp. 12]
MDERPRLGVLGGMGPLATADFMRKVVEATPASCDQDHIPMMVHSVPQIPDRSAAFLSGSDAPWPYLRAGLSCLEALNVRAIAIPCNTAHLWYERLSRTSDVPLLHIGEAAAQAVLAQEGRIRKVGLLATSATLKGEIYQARLQARGVEVVLPDSAVQQELVMPGIQAVKSGNLALGAELLQEACARLRKTRIDGLLLGCTELPVVMPTTGLEIPVFDTTDLLARSCVAWWMQQTTGCSFARG